MRIARFAQRVLFAAIFLSTSLVCTAQPPATPVPAPDPPPALPTATATLQPALESVHHTLDGLHLDRWKKGSIRDEATQNIAQIVRDIDVNLPPMLHDADASPGTISKALPVARNVNALYDVLLRVSEGARIAGPDDQVDQLQKALVTLGNARLALADSMQASAESIEKQVVDLRTAIKAQANRPAAPAPVVLPCVPPPPHRTTKKTAKPSAKPAPKPSTTPSNSTATPAPAKPSN